jgi:hypothetical protein
MITHRARERVQPDRGPMPQQGTHHVDIRPSPSNGLPPMRRAGSTSDPSRAPLPLKTTTGKRDEGPTASDSHTSRGTPGLPLRGTQQADRPAPSPGCLSTETSPHAIHAPSTRAKVRLERAAKKGNRFFAKSARNQGNLEPSAIRPKRRRL